MKVTVLLDRAGRISIVAVIAFALTACFMGPRITRTQNLSESADVPYEKILVIALYASYESRKRLEKEVVAQLSERGTNAVASTSMMKTTTPMKREVYLAMLDEFAADGVLVTQLVSIDSDLDLKDASPEATYNVTPTYYFNVWNVELTEYVEPPFLEVESQVVLATQMLSVRRREAVWAIESETTYVKEAGDPRAYYYFVDEAKAIIKHLSQDGLIAP